MKKLFVAFGLLLALASHAQTEKGSFLVGGGLGLQTGENSSQFSLNPNFGYFFADNFAAGASLGFDFRKSGNVKQTEVGIGPFARYYFGKTTTKPFVVTELDFLNSTTKTGSVNIKSTGFGFLFGLGFAAFINENIAVEGVSGYNYNKFKDFDGSGGFSLRLGFQLYFNNKSVKDLKTNVLGK